MDWHERLGHLNEESLTNMVANGIVAGVEIEKGHLGICETCVQGKQSQNPFPKSESKRSKELLEIVQTFVDLCKWRRKVAQNTSWYSSTIT